MDTGTLYIRAPFPHTCPRPECQTFTSVPLHDSLSSAVSPGQSLSHRRPTAPHGLDSSCPTLL